MQCLFQYKVERKTVPRWCCLMPTLQGEGLGVKEDDIITYIMIRVVQVL